MGKFLIPVVIVLLIITGGAAFYFTKYGQTISLSEAGTNKIPQTESKDSLQPVPTETIMVDTGGEIKTINPTTNRISLKIISPADNTEVTSSTITIQGMTEPSVDVSVNEKDMISDAKGYFSTSYNLDEGDNYIIVVAVDKDGNEAERELNITYTPAE